MKLRNKKTGEIKNVNHNKVLIHFNDGQTECIKCLAEFNEDWEDYEEDKYNLDPALIKFIKHYLEINNIKLEEVKTLEFELYDEWARCLIDGIFDSKANEFEFDPKLLNDNIEGEKEYTPEQLGLK